MASVRETDALALDAEQISNYGHRLHAGDFILGATVEQLNLPDNITAAFSLSTSLARLGLSVANTSHIAPGFHGALTLAIKNLTRNHRIEIYPNMLVGQLVFHKHNSAGSYTYGNKNGRYHGSQYPQPSRGVLRE